MDSPLAWAAKHLGCDLFSVKLRRQLVTSVFASADAICIALQACRESQKQCPDLLPHPESALDRLSESPNVLKLMACLQKWCDASLVWPAWDSKAGRLFDKRSQRYFSLTEWFAEAVRLEAQHLPGLEQIRQIAQQVLNTTDLQPPFEWLYLAMSTGSLELVREVVRSLPPGHVEFRSPALARAAWEARR